MPFWDKYIYKMGRMPSTKIVKELRNSLFTRLVIITVNFRITKSKSTKEAKRVTKNQIPNSTPSTRKILCRPFVMFRRLCPLPSYGTAAIDTNNPKTL